MKLSESIGNQLIYNVMSKIPMVKEVKKNNSKNKKYDFEIISYEEKMIKMKLKMYNEIYPRHISKLVEETNDKEIYTVIIAPYISENTHSLCEENNIGYFDFSGNCLFHSDNFYILVKGNKNAFKAKKVKNNIFNSKAIVSSKILRVILQDVAKPVTLKKLSKEAECSIGQVSKVKDFLNDYNLGRLAKDGLHIEDVNELMLNWANEYMKKEDNEKLYFTFDNLAECERKLEVMKQTLGIDYYLTGISGGVRYAPIVRYNAIHVYINPEEISQAMQFLGCKEVASGANMIIYPLEDKIYTFDSRMINHSSVVSPVQIYLDCMTIKGRGEELANEVLRKEINKYDT